MLAALAWRNLWRRPQRTVLSLISIAIATGLLVFLLSFQFGVYSTMKETTLRIFDGYAQLQPVGYAADPSLERVIDHPERIARQAEGVDGVGAASPRVNGFAILANGERSYVAAVVGVDPAGEVKISSIASTIQFGRYLEASDTDSAILGDALARNLRLTVGGRVTVLGSARDGSVATDVLRVAGIFHSGIPELDRSVLEMPLARAQSTFGMSDAANTIALSGPSLSDVNRALPSLRALGRESGVSVMDWTDLEPALRDAISLDFATGMLFYATLVLVAAFIILNTLLMSVLERTGEFGTLLALGMRPGQIGAIVWIELFALALLGCSIGLAAGASVTLWFQQQGIDIPRSAGILAQLGLPSRLFPSLTVLSAAVGPAALLVAITFGGLVPYLRVARLTPAAAIRAA